MEHVEHEYDAVFLFKAIVWIGGCCVYLCEMAKDRYEIGDHHTFSWIIPSEQTILSDPHDDKPAYATSERTFRM